MDNTVGPDVKPEISFLSEILKRVRSGEIRVPRFQRPFVWSRGQMLALLDSIRKKFPIGSLLLWETKPLHLSLERLGPVLIAPPQKELVRFLLDGHQRVSTLVGVFLSDDIVDFGDDEDPLRWRVWYNARTDNFEHPREDEELKPYHFPLNRLLNTLPFLAESQRILSSGDPEATQWVEKAQILNRTFNEYKLASTVIADADLNQAVEIFARLNKTGRTVSQNEMASALLFSDELSLDSNISEILTALGPYGFERIDRDFILRTCLADLNRDLYKTDWTTFKNETKGHVARELRERLPHVKQGLIRAAQFLQAIGVPSARLLPYSIQIVFLGAFFARHTSPSERQLEFLRRWFWVSSFTGTFAPGNPARVKRMLKEILDLPEHPSDNVLVEFDFNEPALPFPRTFDLRSARVKTYLLAVLSLHPLDLDGNQILDLGQRLRTYGPWTFGYLGDHRELTPGNAKSPANRVVAVAPERRELAKGWIRRLTPDTDLELSILESHALPDIASDMIEGGRLNELIESRLEYLINVERAFMKRNQVVPPIGNRTGIAALDSDDESF